jgi:phenylacetate-CoA ligase
VTEALADPDDSHSRPSSRTAELQSQRARAMYAHAWEHCRFYRDLWRSHGLGARSVQGVDDLRALPVVTRDELQRHGDDIRVAGEILHEGLTGGTTGHRFRWAYSEAWARLFYASLLRGLGWAGLTAERRVLVLTSNVAAGALFPATLQLPEPLDRRRVPEYLAEIDAFAPDAIYGYTSNVYFLAEELLARGRMLPLRACVVSSETLVPEWRDVMERAYGCPVYDNYGCNDGGIWGAQCEHRLGFHQDVDRAVLEFDERGRMIATDLWNTAFPFFRYATGDEGGWLDGPCACRRTTPRFRVRGRSADMIITPAGPRGPTQISMALMYPGVDAVRLLQHALDDLELLYVPNRRFVESDFHASLERLVVELGGLVPRLHRVEEIPRSVAGKHRVSVNLMASSRAGRR